MKNPERSEGARTERKAFREYLRRKIKTSGGEANGVFNEVLSWVLNRQARYDKKAGGLGRK